MRAIPNASSILPRLSALSIAASLSFAAGASFAGTATLNITGFSATANTANTFVFTTGSSQTYSMTALIAGGLSGSATNSYTANDWNLGPNRTAAVPPNARATGLTTNFVDGLTGLTTAGFNLSATGLFGGPRPNSGNAGARESGDFVLLDAFDVQTAGSITFDIFYDLTVSNLLGGLPNNYGQSLINLLASDDAGGSANLSDSLFSFNLPGGVGTKSGHFTWTANLGSSDAAHYTLSGTALASSDVPEPGALALVSLALVGMIGVSRRRGQPGAVAA